VILRFKDIDWTKLTPIVVDAVIVVGQDISSLSAQETPSEPAAIISSATITGAGTTLKDIDE
jgi:hypothetical protein